MKLFQSIVWSDLRLNLAKIKRMQIEFLREYPSIPRHLSILDIDYTVENDKEPFKLRMRTAQQVQEEDGPTANINLVIPSADILFLMQHQYGLRCQDMMRPFEFNMLE